MTKLKYYEASVDNDNFAVVEATSPGQAKNKFINGNVVPFFAGYDNFDCEFTEVRVRRLKVCDGLGDEPLSVVAEMAMKKADWVWTMDGVEYTADDISEFKMQKQVCSK